MSSKINIGCIVTDHMETLVDEGTRKRSTWDYITFFGIPVVVGLAGYYASVKIDKDIAAGAISALSIFAGLLINVLVLIYTIKSGQHKGDVEDLEARFLRQIFSNLSFAILISVLTTILLVTVPGLADYARGLTAIIIACSSNFVLTLMMALKRLHLLLRQRF